jgi:hypothetical protein
METIDKTTKQSLEPFSSVWNDQKAFLFGQNILRSTKHGTLLSLQEFVDDRYFCIIQFINLTLYQ